MEDEVEVLEKKRKIVEKNILFKKKCTSLIKITGDNVFHIYQVLLVFHSTNKRI